jgi:hypothetical protein
VREWKANGQTARAFAQGREFKASTLTYWTYRLRQAATQQPTAATPVERPPRSSTASRVRMVRVRPTTRIQPQSPTRGGVGTYSATLVITVGAAR